MDVVFLVLRWRRSSHDGEEREMACLHMYLFIRLSRHYNDCLHCQLCTVVVVYIASYTLLWLFTSPAIHCNGCIHRQIDTGDGTSCYVARAAQDGRVFKFSIISSSPRVCCHITS